MLCIGTRCRVHHGGNPQSGKGRTQDFHRIDRELSGSRRTGPATRNSESVHEESRFTFSLKSSTFYPGTRVSSSISTFFAEFRLPGRDRSEKKLFPNFADSNIVFTGSNIRGVRRNSGNNMGRRSYIKLIPTLPRRRRLMALSMRQWRRRRRTPEKD